MTPIELEAVEGFRAAEHARVAALSAYNTYIQMVKDAGGYSATDHTFYHRWKDAGAASRVAVRLLSRLDAARCLAP